MAKESWAMFGSVVFALALALPIFPLHRYQTSHSLTFAWAFVQYFMYMYVTFTASFAHAFFLHYYCDKNPNRPYKPIGWFKKLVRDMISVGLAPILLHQLAEQFPSMIEPYAWWLPHGWTFLLGLMCFTIAYRVWAHMLNDACEFEFVVDTIVGSGFQAAVYAVSRGKNFYLLMVLILLYGCFSCCGHPMYSARVVDFVEVDLEQGLTLPLRS